MCFQSLKNTKLLLLAKITPPQYFGEFNAVIFVNDLILVK